MTQRRKGQRTGGARAGIREHFDTLISKKATAITQRRRDSIPEYTPRQIRWSDADGYKPQENLKLFWLEKLENYVTLC